MYMKHLLDLNAAEENALEVVMQDRRAGKARAPSKATVLRELIKEEADRVIDR